MIVYQACVTVSLFMLLTSVILFFGLMLCGRVFPIPSGGFVRGVWFFWITTLFITGTTGMMWINMWMGEHRQFWWFPIGLALCWYWGTIHGKWYARMMS